jgi:hypothetical protein
MLRACALQYGRSWDKSLPYAEFSYNNNYQESLKMAPFEMLYGRKCQTPLFWSETGERKVFGPDMPLHILLCDKAPFYFMSRLGNVRSSNLNFEYNRFESIKGFL